MWTRTVHTFVCEISPNQVRFVNNSAVLSVNGGVPASVTLPRFTPVNQIRPRSQTSIGATDQIEGFGQIGQGCVRKFLINEEAVDLQRFFRILLATWRKLKSSNLTAENKNNLSLKSVKLHV